MDARRRFAGVGAACVLVCFFSACGGSPLSLGSPAPPISVSVSPAIAAVQTGSTALLTATVSNDPGYRGVTWTVSCAATLCGSITPVTTPSGASATYTAPATMPSSASITVTATAGPRQAKASSATLIPGGPLPAHNGAVDSHAYGLE